MINPFYHWFGSLDDADAWLSVSFRWWINISPSRSVESLRFPFKFQTFRVWLLSPGILRSAERNWWMWRRWEKRQRNNKREIKERWRREKWEKWMQMVPCREICNVSDWIFKEKILKEMRLNRLFGVVKVHEKFVFCEFSAYSWSLAFWLLNSCQFWFLWSQILLSSEVVVAIGKCPCAENRLLCVWYLWGSRWEPSGGKGGKWRRKERGLKCVKFPKPAIRLEEVDERKEEMKVFLKGKEKRRHQPAAPLHPLLLCVWCLCGSCWELCVILCVLFLCRSRWEPSLGVDVGLFGFFPPPRVGSSAAYGEWLFNFRFSSFSWSVCGIWVSALVTKVFVRLRAFTCFRDSYSWICEHTCMGIFSNHALDWWIIAPVGAFLDAKPALYFLKLVNWMLGQCLSSMLFIFDAFLQIGERWCPLGWCKACSSISSSW